MDKNMGIAFSEGMFSQRRIFKDYFSTEKKELSEKVS